MLDRMVRALVAGGLIAGALSSVVLAQSAPGAFTTGYRYDLARRLTGTIGADPDGAGPRTFAATRNTYDAAGRLIRVEKGELAAWQAETVAPPAWAGFTVVNQMDSAYDAMGRKIREAVSSGGTALALTQYSYDSVGRLECTAVRMNPSLYGALPPSACTPGTQGTFGPDRITKSIHDQAGQLLRIQKAYGTSLQQDYAVYTYSQNGKQTSVTDANGNKTTMDYDPYDRFVKQTFPSKTTAGAVNAADSEVYTYDNSGNRLSVKKRNGKTIGYSYDALNRVTLKDIRDIPDTTASDVYYGYDLRGLQTYARFASKSGVGITNTYDGFGRLASSTSTMGGYSRALSYQSDADGNRTRVQHADGVQFDYVYDGLNRMISGNNPATAAKTLDITYDAAGRRSKLASDYGYTSYSYDGASRLSAIASVFSTASDNVATGFTYSPASQVLSRSRDNAGYAFPAVAPVTRGYTVNGLNQYLTVGSTTIAHDDNGNLISDGTTTYVYDAENRLISASGAMTVNLTWDPLGRLFQTSGGSSGTTQFLYDGNDMVAEYDGAGALLRRYVHGSGDDDPVVWYEGSSTAAANRRFLYADSQGSIVGVANASGAGLAKNAYDEYGVPKAGNVGRFQYTGQAWIPELGMYHYKARIYSPTLGRFLQTDPVGYGDGLNWYAYVGNDPLNRRDPSGTLGDSICSTGDNCTVNGVDHDEAAMVAANDDGNANGKGQPDSAGGQGGKKADVQPRPLTDEEIAIYSQFYPESVLEDVNVYDGKVPFWLSSKMAGVTLGNNIYFRPGAYRPNTPDGVEILGHEIDHVQQFKNGMNMLSYLLASRHGYTNNKFETEAYAKGAEIRSSWCSATGVSPC